MRHGAGGRDLKIPVAHRAGGGSAAADKRGARSVDRGFRALCAARAEFRHRTAVGGAHDAVCLGRDEGLVVEGEQDERFDELRFDCGRAHGHDRFARKNRRSLRDCVDIAGKAEGFQIFEEFFVKNLFGTQIGDVFLREFQIFDILDDLVESCGDREASAVGNIPEKNVEMDSYERMVIQNQALTTSTKQLSLQVILQYKDLERLYKGEVRNLSDIDWPAVYKLIDKIFNNYTRRLRASFPLLTEEDIQCCCLIKLQLSTSAIARLYSIAPSSVTKRKQRIKERINQGKNELIGKDQPADVYLWGF